jgi:L-fuculose-phosphate aldolase
MSKERALRSEIVAIAQRMSRTGLSPGRSGNVSARFEDGMLITPSALVYDQMLPDDVVCVAADGSVASGQRRPALLRAWNAYGPAR